MGSGSPSGFRAALANCATLVAISIFIFVEAWERFHDPPAVQGALMMGIATGGLAIDLVGLRSLNAGRGESLNMRGAWLHVLTDALGSVGATLGGFLICAFGWAWADPAVSVLIGLLVIFSSWNLLRETVAVLMESAPAGVDLSAHVRVADGQPGNAVLAVLRDRLRDGFGMGHMTIQVEHEDFEEPATHA